MKFLNKHLEALATAALVLFSLMAVGCSSGKERSTAYTAEAVYLNEANSISILVRDPVDNSLSVKRIQTQFDMVFKDDIVDSRVHLWVNVQEKQELGGWIIEKVIVHVHSVGEIQPGYWNHGKFGHGQDQEVE